ncbi:hypothetical protein CPTSV76_200 [Enterobacteria phage SV76]|nr:hypothetical protein CPTSV76_200 [Enterobacteria phage SV76]
MIRINITEPIISYYIFGSFNFFPKITKNIPINQI